MEYLKHLGITTDLHSINKTSKVVLVRNEINYKAPATYDEVLNIYTRIVKIGNTSFIFEGRIEEVRTQRLISENVAYHVWLNPENNEPMSVPEEFRKCVRVYEG